MCSTCSSRKFKDTNAKYVEGTVRFYLTGEDYITTRGLAFLQHPYWISTDDPSAEIILSHGSAYRLAQRIYEEKIFFKNFVPSFVSRRPRDDKAHAIRKMIEIFGCTKDVDEGMSSAEPRTISSAVDSIEAERSSEENAFENDTDRMESDHSDDRFEREENGSLSEEELAKIEAGVEEGDNATKTFKRDRSELNWVKVLPETLLSVFAEQKRRLERGQDSPPLLGTVPLRDLVRSLHSRLGAVPKSL